MVVWLGWVVIFIGVDHDSDFEVGEEVVQGEVDHWHQSRLPTRLSEGVWHVVFEKLGED